MVSSMALRGDAVRSQEAGCDGYLTKPVKRAVLFDAIAMVIGRSKKEQQNLVTRHSVRESGRPKLRVLLAEDNLVNQKVTSRLLERCGHEVVCASSGQEALSLLDREGPFGVVLMDVQMPEMDGFEATRRIRREPGHAHLPVIALTAHAMKGDRERCLAAGMDDYLTKPVQVRELQQVVDRWARTGRGTPEGEAQPRKRRDQDDDLPVLDVEEALARVMDDRELLEEATALLIHDVPHVLRALREALGSGDTEEVRRRAHALKGAASNLSAKQMVRASRDLEQRAEHGDSGELSGGVERVEAAWEQLRAVLDEEFGP